MLLISAMAVHAATTGDMLIYSGRFNNGWGDNWSYRPHYPTNNPIHSGSNAMAFVPDQSWNAFTNTGLANGTLYSFVVSGMNAAGEGAISAEVSARPTS